MPSDRPLLLGHRGARRYAPENTLPAFELALQHGCDGFELDLRRTSDGRLVCFHDPGVGKLQVADATAEQLAQAAGVSVAGIPEMLAAFAQRAFINIELKIIGAEDQLVSELNANPVKRGLLVSSFLPQALEAMRGAAPDVPLGYISDDRNELELWRRLPISHVALHHTLLTPSTFEELRQAGMQIFVWTLNTEAEMRRFAALGVDGIISDDTALLADVFRDF